MKKTTTLLTILVIFRSLSMMAEKNEPCKEVMMPAEILSSKVIFQIPTYDEYVRGLVMGSINEGVFVSEEHILNEATYKKIRKSKIKTIKGTYTGDFQIMSANEVKEGKFRRGYIFEEMLIAELVSETNQKFEQYTAFSIKNMATATSYILADPSKGESSNCFVEKGKYKYSELISLLQKK